MSRNRIILLNKMNKVLKILSYNKVHFNINYSSVDLILPVVTLNDEPWEKLILMFNKERINWQIKMENNSLILNIWI